jgi:hypothetical protein
MSAATRKLCLLHLVANALLLWLGYEWLGVAESTRVRLALSALDALAILALACWLHGAAFVYFRNEPKINESFRIALRRLPLLVLAAIVVLALYGLVAWAAGAAGQPAFQFASWMTLHLRKPVKPATIMRIVQVLFWTIRWVVLPVALIPLLAGILMARRQYTWRYCLAVPVLLLLGLQLPLVLLHWVPPLEPFAMQFASLAIRGLVGYCLFVTSALMLAFVTSRGR